MKPSKHLIIRLLVNDMKHEQLLTGLHRLGFESDLHGSNLCDVVAELMGKRRGMQGEEWQTLYVQFMEKAGSYTITGNGHNLLPLAEQCYECLASLR